MSAQPNSASGAKERDIFLKALDKPTPEERAAYLDGACGDNLALRAAVDSLLKHHLEDSFLEAPATELPHTRKLPDTFVAEGPGSVIGRYKLLQKIGEGGCGVVYMAEQEEPVRRRVALKIIKLGMDTRSVIARFEAERQALAMMDHPNIAKVFDAGATETGRPYFVMELVRGIRITDFCDQNNLSTRERLDLFVQVCHAIQHAHQKGIIHRDIKPSNILVTMHDDVPVPKVIEFGIVKATEQRLTDKTLFTQFEQIIGTPAYMSPEQAQMSGLELDTRSDIYALSVLLYELLTGKTPFEPEDLLRAGFDEMRRTIREEEPPRPSTRLSTLAADALTSIAQHRRTEPPKLISLLRGDLDWIVMKALEKNRSRRYASASEFAADITRFFNDEPVIARPPSATYRLQKFVRKHKGPVAAAAAVAATIIVLGSVALWQGTRAQQQAKRVRAQSLITSAAAAQDPLLKAQLLLEVADLPELPGALSVAREAADDALPIAVFRGHEYTFTCAAISPDGQHIVTGSRDGTARLWRVDGTEEPRVWPHENGVWSAAFTPDGTRVVTGTGGAAANVGTTNRADAYLVYVWRVDGIGKPILLRGHEERVGCVAVSTDGRRIVTGSEDQTARIWRTDGTGEHVVLRGHEGKIRSVAFSPDGTKVVTASDDMTARVWNADGTGEPVVLRGHTGRIKTAVFSPDGTRVVTASDDNTARVWRADGSGQATVLSGRADLDAPKKGFTSAFFSADGSRVFATDLIGSAWVYQANGTLEFDLLEGRGGEFSRAVFSPDGSRAAAVISTTAGFVVGWTGACQRVNGGHERPISLVAFSPDSTRLFTLSDDSIRVWQVDRKPEPVILRGSGQTRGDTSFAFSPNGERVVVGSEDGRVRIWRADGTGEPVVLRGHEGPVQSVSFSVDGTRVFTASPDRTLRTWQSDGTGGVTLPWRGFERPVSWTALSPDGARVLVCFKHGTLQIWRLDGMQDPVTLPPPPDQFFACGAFSPDGTRVAVTDLYGSAFVWRTDGTGERVVFRGHLDEVLSVAFSADGQRVVSTSTDGTARIWRADDARELVVLRGHEGWVGQAAFSPDGTRVATALAGGPFYGTIRVWRADGEAEPLRLHARADVSRVAFSPDGTRLAAGLQDGTVHIWQITWPALLAHLRANVHVPLTPEQRMKFLSESASEAWANYVEAERRLGHKPQAKW